MGQNNPQRKVVTSTQRSRDRVSDLNAVAVLFGYPTWRKFETAVIRRYRARVGAAAGRY